jgi:hypothetical protein
MRRGASTADAVDAGVGIGPTQGGPHQMNEAAKARETRQAWGGNGDTARVTLATAPLRCLRGRQRRNGDNGNSARATRAKMPMSRRQRWHRLQVDACDDDIAATATMVPSRQRQWRQRQDGNDAHCNNR